MSTATFLIYCDRCGGTSEFGINNVPFCRSCGDAHRIRFAIGSEVPPRSQGEIEEKKFEQLIQLPDGLHDAEGRPMSLAVEKEDEAKLSAFIEGVRSEPRCSFCGQPEWHQDHHGQIHNADMRHHLFQKADQ